MHTNQRPKKEYYMATSNSCAIGCNEIKWYIYYTYITCDGAYVRAVFSFNYRNNVKTLILSLLMVYTHIFVVNRNIFH